MPAADTDQLQKPPTVHQHVTRASCELRQDRRVATNALNNNGNEAITIATVLTRFAAHTAASASNGSFHTDCEASADGLRSPIVSVCADDDCMNNTNALQVLV